MYTIHNNNEKRFIMKIEQHLKLTNIIPIEQVQVWFICR